MNIHLVNFKLKTFYFLHVWHPCVTVVWIQTHKSDLQRSIRRCCELSGSAKKFYGKVEWGDSILDHRAKTKLTPKIRVDSGVAAVKCRIRPKYRA